MSAFFSDMGLFWDLLIPGLILGVFFWVGALVIVWAAYKE